MSIKEIQARHEAMDDYVNEVADAESSFSDAESLFVETHRHRKELLDALKEIGDLVDGWLMLIAPPFDKAHCSHAIEACATEVRAILDKL